MPPLSGIRPIAEKLWMNLADLAATTMSQASAMFAPAPAATPLTRAMTGWGKRRQRADERVPALLDGLAEVDRFARRDRAVVEVLPGAEAASRAGQHDDARIAEVGERVAQLLVHLRGEAVEPVGPVERDPGDRAVRLEVDGLVSHAVPTSEGEGVDANELANRVAHADARRGGHRARLGHQDRGSARRIMRACRWWSAPTCSTATAFAHGGMIFALADTAFAYVCNGANHASVAAQASIVFLDKVSEGETLIAEAKEVAREGRAGVTRVAVRTGDGRGRSPNSPAIRGRSAERVVDDLNVKRPRGYIAPMYTTELQKTAKIENLEDPEAPRGVRGAGRGRRVHRAQGLDARGLSPDADAADQPACA